MRSLCPRTLSAFLTLVLLAGPARSATRVPATPFTRLDATAARMVAITSAARAARANTPVRAPETGATLLAVDADAVRAFRDAGGGPLSLPAADGGTVELELEPYTLFADGSGPTYTDDRGRHPFSPDVSLFRGRVAGDEQGWVVIAMSGAGVFGVIEQAGERLTLGPVQKVSGPNAAAAGVLALAPEGD